MLDVYKVVKLPRGEKAEGFWAVSYWLLAVSCWPLAVGYWLLAVSYWPLAVSCWRLAVSAWRLAISCWLLAVGLQLCCIVVVDDSMHCVARLFGEEVGNALDGALLVEREGFAVDANKRVPVGARLVLYGM